MESLQPPTGTIKRILRFACCKCTWPLVAIFLSFFCEWATGSLRYPAIPSQVILQGRVQDGQQAKPGEMDVVESSIELPPFERTEEYAFNLIRRAVKELDGKGQLTPVGNAFYVQLKKRRIEDAVLSLNALVQDPDGGDEFFNKTQAVYYENGNYVIRFGDLLKVVEHPRLKVSDNARRYRADGLRDSMVHVLVQIPLLEEAIMHASEMSMKPETLTQGTEMFNPLGMHLCDAWGEIAKWYMKQGQFDDAIKICRRFEDPEVRRRMMSDFEEEIIACPSVLHREELLRLFEGSKENAPERVVIKEDEVIAKLLNQGDLDQAEALIISYESFENYSVLRRAVQLVESFQKAGLDDRAESLLRFICQTPGHRVMNGDIAEALKRGRLFDLAIEFLGPLRISSDMTSPLFVQYHQPLYKFAEGAIKDGDLSNAIRFADAIQEPAWRSSTFMMLYKKAKAASEVQRESWFQVSIDAASKIKDERLRDWKLLIQLGKRPPKTQAQKEELGALIKDPKLRASLLADWIVLWLASDSMGKEEMESCIDEVAKVDPSALEDILDHFIEAKNVEDAVKIAKRYQHADSMSAYRFRYLFELMRKNKQAISEMLDIARVQPVEHRQRVLYYAFNGLESDQHYEFAKRILPRLDGTEVDLDLTNKLLQVFSANDDLKGMIAVLNLKLPENQFRYDEPSANAWRSVATGMSDKLGAWSMIDFSKRIHDRRVRAETFALGISELLRETHQSDAGFETAIKTIEKSTDSIAQGHAMMVIAKAILELPKKQ